MIEHYLESANQFLLAHPYYGLLFAFFVALAESLPVIGTLIPGSITMTFIGILVGRNLMPLGFTLLLGTIGAIIGDVIGFAIGKHYKERLHTIWPFRKYEKLLKLLTMGERFFQKHGGKSIIIGRFIGPTRSSVPLIAGLLKMRWSNFMVAALPSAFLWALLYLLPGVLIGAISLALPKEKATTFTLAGLACIVFLWLLFWAIQRFFVFLANIINRYVDRCWSWLNRHHSTKTIIRIISCKHNPQDHHQLTLLILASVSVLIFGYIFLCVTFHIGIYHLDQPIFYFLQSIRSQRGDIFFIVFTELGDKYTLFSIAVIIALVLTLRRQWRTLWHLLALVLLTFGSTWALKHIFYFPRPAGFIEVAKSSSFPSGHTTLSLGLLGFFSYLCAHCLAKPWRWIPYLLTSLAILLVAISRLYLGAHWFCDVLAAIFLGATLLLLIIAAYRRQDFTIKKPVLLLNCIILAILIPWAVMSVKNFHRDNYRYTPYYPQQITSVNNWWDFPGTYLPIYRLNRFGHPIQPFNIQWAGNIKKIKNNLLQHGWLAIKTKENLQYALRRFSSKAPEQHLAFLPQLYHHHAPVLYMLKRLPRQENIIEIRLWKTSIQFNDKHQQLYIGSINYRAPATSLIDLKPRAQITLENSGGLQELIANIKKNYKWKTFTIEPPIVLKKIYRLQWNGMILMIRSKR